MKRKTLKQSLALALASTLATVKRHNTSLVLGACLASGLLSAPLASAQSSSPITTVFYILLENRCFTSGSDTSYTNIIFQNKNGASPYLTSLCTPNSATSAQVSFCSCYHNDLSVYDNSGPSIHPSEPQYVWMEAGSNLSKLDDNDPYFSGASVAQIANFLAANPGYTGENLSELLQNAGISWTSYTEGTCLLNSNGLDFNTAGGTLTNNIAASGTRTVPLVSFSGSSNGYTNAYNGTHEYNFAAKHTGQLFFPATNGSTITTPDQSPANVEVSHYEPLEQLQTDLNNNTQAQYCVITPDQYNDGHTALPHENFTYGGTTYTKGSDLERIAQMDSFCSIIVPQIQASPVYQAGHAAIVIWTDETEGSPVNDFYHTLTEIVISPYTKGNAYNSTLNYTHSSDVATFQKIFGVTANTATGYLNDAANLSNATPNGVTVGTNTGQGLQVATGQPFYGFGTGTAQDMSDLFVANTVPALPGLSFTAGGYAFNRKTNTDAQTIKVTNTKSTAITAPIYLVVSNLSSNTSIVTGSAGTTVNNYTGSPYYTVSGTGLAAGATATISLQYTAPSSGAITSTMNVISTTAAP